MSTEVDINAIMRNWRSGVKKKQRGVANFQERAALRLGVIERMLRRQVSPVDDWQLREARLTAVGQYAYVDKKFRPVKVGQNWGGPGITGFFRRRITIPRSMAGNAVYLRVYFGGDALLSLDGVPFHGLDPFRHDVPLTARAKGGESVQVDVEAYVRYHGEQEGAQTFAVAELFTRDDEVWRAYWDFQCAIKALEINNLDPRLENFLVDGIWEALAQIPLQDPDSAHQRACVLQAAESLRQTVYAGDRFKGEGLMYLVGHSHLDVVFLWPYKEFVRKVGRTHATMLRLMDAYPQFKFCQSQAKLYADMKKHFPALFEQVKKRVKEGRWELIGAFWVEPDCNLISGESFVRQILYGQKFFMEEFGFQSRTCWQPDVFGLSFAMPQILKRSGIEYFLTNKMVPWNDTNPWKKHTFWWQGNDGSKVLAIVPPGHFIGTVDPDLIDTQWRNFSDKSEIGQTLHVYGWGDGGGGPDLEMLESAVRYQDFPGLVKLKFANAEEAFDQIAAQARTADLPVVRDELYLEAHRGTYTNKGTMKKANRRLEFLYREAEMLAALAWTRGTDYPAASLLEGWQELLTSQFHDSLPGTHVPEVHGDLLADYAKIQAIGEQIRNAAAQTLMGAPARNGESLAALNTLAHDRSDLLAVPADLLGKSVLADASGAPVVQQRVKDLYGNSHLLAAIGSVPGVGCRPMTMATGAAPAPSSNLKVARNLLENEFLRVRFNEHGEISSIFDKEHQREVLAQGQTANRFQLFEDTPGKYEAWDIVATYKDHEIDIAAPVTISIDETGPLRASVLLERPIAGSRLRQRISLIAGSRQIIFETRIDWTERQRLLKVAFPVDVNAMQATYDMAFGTIARPTHRNTSYDAAKFEVCGHLWMDLSQSDYGVSLLNDCKYGHECDGNLMRLTLLKGALWPDPNADKESHSFTYVLYPHAGTWREAQTHARALELNVPMRLHQVARPRQTPECRRFVQLEGAGLFLEALKRSEDGRDLIVRVVERTNARVRGRLTLDQAATKAWTCDLMERKETALTIRDGRVDFVANPCEILTLRIALHNKPTPLPPSPPSAKIPPA